MFQLNPRKNIYVVYDRNVETFAKLVCDGWEDTEGWVVNARYPISADESHKTLAQVEDICRWLMNEGADRNATLAAIGGGVVSDIVGFAAGIYKRGIEYISVPTTLLAQVDASIGGKCASNLDGVKNVIGLFNQPEKVLIFSEPLETLSVKEWHSGAAELLKTCLVADPLTYQSALEIFQALHNENYSSFAKDAVSEALVSAVSRVGSIKSKIVKKDPYDHDQRMVLNLGHTFGHAIEWWQSQPCNKVKEPFAHGEAVAIGIIQAARLSEARGIADGGLAEKLTRDFVLCGLPTELPCPMEELEPAFQNDKKSVDGEINFVFLKGVGRPVVKSVSPAELFVK